MLAQVGAAARLICFGNLQLPLKVRIKPLTKPCDYSRNGVLDNPIP